MLIFVAGDVISDHDVLDIVRITGRFAAGCDDGTVSRCLTLIGNARFRGGTRLFHAAALAVNGQKLADRSATVVTKRYQKVIGRSFLALAGLPNHDHRVFDDAREALAWLLQDC